MAMPAMISMPAYVVRGLVSPVLTFDGVPGAGGFDGLDGLDGFEGFVSGWVSV